jgi:hypothetical protein
LLWRIAFVLRKFSRKFKMQTPKVVGRIKPTNTALFVCDVQEKFRPVISHFPSVEHVSKVMVRFRNWLLLEQLNKGQSRE